RLRMQPLLAACHPNRERDRARLAERVGIAPCFERRGEPGDAFERLLGTAELRQQQGAIALQLRAWLGQATLLAERNPLFEGGQRPSRAFKRIAGDGEVVLQDGGVPSGATLDK